MSISNLFYNNDFSLHANQIIANSETVNGDLTINDGNLTITRTDASYPSIRINDVNGSWLLYMSQLNNDLSLSQEGGAIDHYFNLNVGNGRVKILGNLEVQKSYIDGTGSQGTSGQILSSTGSITQWITSNTLSSGVFTPTFTTLINLSNINNVYGMYTQNGSIVDVTVTFTADLAAAVSQSQASALISIPINRSNFTTTTQAFGTAYLNSGTAFASYPGYVLSFVGDVRVVPVFNYGVTAGGTNILFGLTYKYSLN